MGSSRQPTGQKAEGRPCSRKYPYCQTGRKSRDQPRDLCWEGYRQKACQMVASIHLFLPPYAINQNLVRIRSRKKCLKTYRLLPRSGLRKKEEQSSGCKSSRLYDLSLVHQIGSCKSRQGIRSLHMYIQIKVVTIESTGIFTPEDIFLRALRVLE